MIGAAAAYMSGLFFASFFSWGSGILLAAGLLPLFYFITRRYKWKTADYLTVILLFIGAVSVSLLYTNNVYNKIVSYDCTYADFTGRITDIRYHDEGFATYTAKGYINDSPRCTVTYHGEDTDSQIGDTLILKNAFFEVPENSYLFSSKDYYKSKGIYITSMAADSAEFVSADTYRLRRTLLNYRHEIISDFYKRMGVDNGAVLSGIVFGEDSAIDSTSETMMYRIGIGHILAVSGLHVSIMAYVLMLFLDFLHINRRVSFCILNIFLILMIIIVESPVSAIRAAIMLDVVYSARIFLRQSDTLNSLAFAVLVICLFNPYAVYDSGFILSVAGTYGIGVFAPYMTRNMETETVPKRFVKNFVSMLCVMLAVFPFSIIYFSETSLISPISNIIIVPLCTIAMIIGMIYTVTGGVISMLSVAGICIDITQEASDFLGSLSFSHISCNEEIIQVSLLLCMLSVLLIYLIFKNRCLAALSLAASVIVFSVSSAVSKRFRYDRFIVAVLGKGTDATVAVSYRDRTDIFDISGYYNAPDYVSKYLTENNISAVSSLTLTQKIQSQFSAYNALSDLYLIGGFFCAGDTGDMLPADNITQYGESSIKYEATDYIMTYSDGRLDIIYGGISISIMKSTSGEKADSDMNIFYGKTGSANFPDTAGLTVTLDEFDGAEYSGINNFEIVISDDNEISIRRL